MAQWEQSIDLDKIKKVARRAREPYKKEALYCFVIQIIVSICLIVLVLGVEVILESSYWNLLGGILVFYMIISCVFVYDLSLLSLLERRANCWTFKEITIESIAVEASWSGYLFTSVIPKLYPEKLMMERYKLRCRDETGKKVILRSAMSGEKYQIIQDRIYFSLPTSCSVVYGKYTHIILYFKEGPSWCDSLNRKY